MISIVYHDPGDEIGHLMVQDLVASLRSYLKVDARAVPMSLVEEEEKPFREGEMVYSLLPFRGGHLATVIEKAEASRALYTGKIPLETIASSLARQLKGCGEITLLYWKAKRFVKEQEEDLSFISKSLEETLKAHVTLETNVEKARGCIAVLTLLPGRVTKKALELHGKDRVKVPFLFDIIKEELIKHIREAIKS